MAKTINSLLGISMTIRNFGTLSNYTMTRRFIQISTNCANKYNKETLVSPRLYPLNEDTQELSNPAILQEAIKNCHFTTEVLSIVRSNESKMTVNDAVFALNALVQSKRRKPFTKSKMYEEPEFLTICEIVKKNVRNLELGDVLTVLKVLIYFEVPATSIIVQTILQILRHSLNELNLQQISFLTFLLERTEKTPLVEALTIALPLVYENHVVMKLDRHNIIHIKNALSFLVERTKNIEIFDIIIHALNNCEQPMTPVVAQSILWSLCKLQCTPHGLTTTLHHTQNILATNMTNFNKWTIRTLVQLIGNKIKAHEPHFYHEGFIDACASAVISEDWGFAEGILMLEKLISIGHTQVPLLDYIAGKCFENPTLLETCPVAKIAVLLYGFSIADYKPVFWDTVKDAIMSDRILKGKTFSYPLTKLAMSLLSLDCYCPQLLEKVFANAIENMDFMPQNEKRRIVGIYQAVKTLFPQYSGPLVDNDFVDAVQPIQSKKSDHYPLINTLECALGGRPYILTNIKSKLGHRIDHAVIMRKGGFPVSINNRKDTEKDEHPTVLLEDLKPPQDSQVILIWCIPQYAYSINTQRMKGIWSMHIKTLETLSGYTVIPIGRTMWTSLTEMERVPYIMQAIRLKCDKLSMSANW